MKNKKLYILMFVFMFCFSIGGVKAVTKECFYEGQVIFTNGNHTGTNFNQTVGVGIKYTCKKNGKCSSEYAAGYTDSNGKSQSLSFTNAKDNFGSNKGSSVYSDGEIKCPSKVVITKTGNNFYFHYKCVSGEAANGKCLGNGVKISEIETPSGNSLQEKVKSITDDGSYYAPSGETTPATQPKTKAKKNTTRNHKSVDNIINYYTVDGKKKVAYGVDGKITCTELIGDDNVKKIHSYLLLICVAGVVIVVILGSLDFIKAIASSDDDALASAGKRIKYRIISVIILLLLPALVNFILSMADDNLHFEIRDPNNNKKKNDISIKLGKASDCGF